MNFIRFDKIIRSGLSSANDICFFFYEFCSNIRYNLRFLSLFIYILYKWAYINYSSQVFEWNSNEFLLPLNNIRTLAFNLGGAYVVACWRVFFIKIHIYYLCLYCLRLICMHIWSERTSHLFLALWNWLWIILKHDTRNKFHVARTHQIISIEYENSKSIVHVSCCCIVWIILLKLFLFFPKKANPRL